MEHLQRAVKAARALAHAETSDMKAEKVQLFSAVWCGKVPKTPDEAVAWVNTASEYLKNLHGPFNVLHLGELAVLLQDPAAAGQHANMPVDPFHIYVFVWFMFHWGAALSGWSETTRSRQLPCQPLNFHDFGEEMRGFAERLSWAAHNTVHVTAKTIENIHSMTSRMANSQRALCFMWIYCTMQCKDKTFILNRYPAIQALLPTIHEAC